MMRGGSGGRSVREGRGEELDLAVGREEWGGSWSCSPKRASLTERRAASRILMMNVFK